MRDEPSYSARFVQPFSKILAGPLQPCPFTQPFSAPPSDGRIPIREANAFLDGAVKQLGDDDLGLKAGRAVVLGVGGILDYAIRSAPTARAATQLAGQYAHMFNDALEISLDVEEARAVVRLTQRLPVSRVVSDFTMAAWYTNHLRAQLGDNAELEAWFQHAEPANLSEYAATFGRAKLRFNAAHDGFVFDKRLLDRNLETSNPVLHAFLRTQLKAGRSELSFAQESMQELRRVITQQLPTGTLNLLTVASAIRVSPRTLARRLESAGTTFSRELDLLRHKLALEYVASPNIPLSQVPYLLGFAHVTSFYRNFKRWTNQTPLKYRRRHADRASWSAAVSGTPDVTAPADNARLPETASR